jgi:hypothetical protein
MTAPPHARRRADRDRDEDVENSPIDSHGTSSESEDIEITPDMSVDELYKVRLTSFEHLDFGFPNVTFI